MPDIKRTYTVTTTQVIEVTLNEKFADPELIREWNETLWPIEGVEDIAQHVAECAAADFFDIELDGLGVISQRYSINEKPRTDASFMLLSQDVESELNDEV